MLSAEEEVSARLPEGLFPGGEGGVVRRDCKASMRPESASDDIAVRK